MTRNSESRRLASDISGESDTLTVTQFTRTGDTKTLDSVGPVGYNGIMNENKNLCPSCVTVNGHEPGCVRAYTLPYRSDRWAGYGRKSYQSKGRRF